MRPVHPEGSVHGQRSEGSIVIAVSDALSSSGHEISPLTPVSKPAPS